MAAPHVASPSSSRCDYDVFLSFRGADTRKAFTDHLYTALVHVGIRTFRDDDFIVRGQDIEDQIRKGIESSKSAVIVFSRDYASSPWCLDELSMIMDRRRTDGLIVIPVFFDVDPEEVSEQSGRYGQAITAYVKQFPVKRKRVTRWRRAIGDVANLAGMVLGNRYEAPFIKDIVREVNQRLNRKDLHVPPYLVGVESHVEKIGSWFRAESSDVKMLVIWGMGGIGKTTIAKVLYNQHYTSFEGSSFLADINRKTLEQPRCMLSLQGQLLSDIQRVKHEEIHDVDEGLVKIRDAVCCKRVLIVLDDVDQLEQFNTILGMQIWLKPGSKLIVTTRDASLLNALEGCKGVEIPPLDDYESLVLFSMHAFRKYPPEEGYAEHSNAAVNYCRGLPLALEALGSYFGSKRDVDVWESALREIQEVSHPQKIQKTLRMSYDSLPFDDRKDLFLDIACFFVAMKKNYVATIADGCGYYSKVGIQDLIDKCLITIGEDNMLMMHQLVRDMGRKIVHEESPSDPGKRSRLWNDNDAKEVLSQHSGTESIQGLSLNLNLPTSKQAMSNAQQNSSSMESFRVEAFANMKRLKLLHLRNVKLDGDYKNFPKNLVWLYWQGCCLDFIPNDLCLEKLVVLEMSNSSLTSLWSGTQLLPKLKILNLSHSQLLVTTPNLDGLPSLEKLILEGCSNLVRIDGSKKEMMRISYIDARDCKSIGRIPAVAERKERKKKQRRGRKKKRRRREERENERGGMDSV